MPSLTRNKRNGHNAGMETPFNGDSLSDIERTFQPGESPSASRELLHIGKSYEDLLMRTVFRDDNQRNAVITYVYKCEKFHMQAHIDMMLNWMAASPSVGGRSRLEFLQAHTGIIATDLNPSARHMRYQGKGREGEGNQ
jgi:hypothetical protein